MTERESGAGFLVGGEAVQTYNDQHYKKLRERWGLGDDFLATFDFTKNMKGGGGKGGDLMGFTTDKLYDLGVPLCRDAFTPSTRVVSRRRGRGLSLFRV